MSHKSNHDNKNKSPKEDFEEMIQYYLASNPMKRVKNAAVPEVEVRFGTNPKLSKPLSKIDYDNVVKRLYAAGFVCQNPEGLHILRIQNEYTDPRTGVTKISNIRAEIMGVDLIQEYCKTNSIQKLLDLPSTASALSDKIKFTKKSPPQAGAGADGKAPPKMADFTDFNFRVSYQMEQDFTVRSDIAKNIIAKWNDSKKTFRFLNRVRFMHQHYPIFADISIVKGSKKSNRVPIPTYTIQEAGVFTNPESYDVELEIDNHSVGVATRYNNARDLLEVVRKSIRIVLGAIQGSQYPIGYAERDAVLNSYMKMIHDEKYAVRRISPRDFVGPSSLPLKYENIRNVTPEERAASTIGNIRYSYTVTDKADGDRHMLFISDNGRIYMLDTNMRVIFTGAVCLDKTLHHTLVDGEFIRQDKRGNPLNLYAAFDLYYLGGKSVREFGFSPELETDELKNFRLPLLNRLIQKMKLRPLNSAGDGDAAAMERERGIPKKQEVMCDFTVRCKQFYSTSAETTIFEGCSRILSDIKDGLFEYETDGLIFTPMNTGVASDSIGRAGPAFKTTWDRSFKWKPPQYNTNDFLVSVKKDKTGKDEIHNLFSDGIGISGIVEVKQYKTLILRCGFDERKHGYINPWLDVINDRLPKQEDVDDEDGYKPVPFQPSNPSDPLACYCNVLLHSNGNGNMVMKTEEGQVFDEDTIVEFRYDGTLAGAWKWIPLRVRYDKTSELLSGGKNYGNAYHVADSNWTTIQYPILEELIATGENIPDSPAELANDDVYYNRSLESAKDKSSTRALRDFHNLYIKRKLIMGASRRGDTLIDYAVGKAGDLSKWVSAELDFVFGVDISRDNIQNRLDGACARYLTLHKKNRRIPGALFANGTSSANIRSGEAFASEKDREIAKAVFGQGPKDRERLGEGVYKRYGIGERGFQVSSVQFALHYFFENKTVFHGFMRNVAECTALNGYFIGTCYDGETVFNALRKKNEGESIVMMEGDTKIYEITKQYPQTGFPDDDTSLGYAIDVYQETINKVFREYLVSFPFLVRAMEDYGFVPVGRETAHNMGLPNGHGLFDELYKSMESEIRRDPRAQSNYGSALNMSYNEKRISFMNRYFIFQKVRHVNTEKIGKLAHVSHLAKYNDEDDDDDNDAGAAATDMKAATKTAVTKPPRKLNVDKIIIEKYEPVEPAPSSGVATMGKAVVFKKKKSVAARKP